LRTETEYDNENREDCMREENVIFREEQKFGSWLQWLVYLCMGVSIVITIFALIKVSGGDNPQQTSDVVLAGIVGIGVPIGIAVLFLLLKLQIEVQTDGIYVRYFPFHIHFKRYRPEDLSECYALWYRPIWEYGGWGIRYSLRNGKAYNVSGNQGVQLVFKNGKKLLIGSQKPEQLEAAIREIL
jgi:hypothetical protein